MKTAVREDLPDRARLQQRMAGIPANGGDIESGLRQTNRQAGRARPAVRIRQQKPWRERTAFRIVIPVFH